MNAKQKKVSVVITSYNHKKYLIEAIESVIHQTVKVHEIIIADDHSTDGSIETIQDYMNRFPGWIKGVFHKENIGIPKNRNSALRKVTGNYVAILDGDDLFLPRNVEKMMEALENDSKECVYGNIRIINSEGELIRIRDQKKQPTGNIFYEIALGKFGILRNMIINFALLQDIGFLDERFPRYDGFDLTVRLAKHCHFAYVFEPLAEYRVHPTSDSKPLKAIDHLNDLGGIYKKMRHSLKDLSEDERTEIETAWYQILLRYFYQDTIEHGNRIKLACLPLLAIIRGYVSLKKLPAAARFYKRHIKK